MKKLLGIAVLVPLSGVIALSGAGAASATTCGRDHSAAASTGKSISICVSSKVGDLGVNTGKGTAGMSKAATSITEGIDKGVSEAPSKIASLPLPVLKELKPGLKDSDKATAPDAPALPVKPRVPVPAPVGQDAAVVPTPPGKTAKKSTAEVREANPAPARPAVADNTAAFATKVTQEPASAPLTTPASTVSSAAATVAPATELPASVKETPLPVKEASVPASKQGLGFFGIEGVLGSHSFNPASFVISLLAGAGAVTAGLLYWVRKHSGLFELVDADD